MLGTSWDKKQTYDTLLILNSVQHFWIIAGKHLLQKYKTNCIMIILMS